MKAYVDASPTKLCVLREDGRTILRSATTLHTNNEAEYLAVLTAVSIMPDVTEVCSDSELVVKQLNGGNKVLKPELACLAKQISDKAGAEYIMYDGLPDGGKPYFKVTRTGRVKFTWVPREENPAGKLLG